MKPIKNIAKGFGIGAKVEVVRELASKGTDARIGTMGIVMGTKECPHLKDLHCCPDDWNKEPVCCVGYMDVHFENGDILHGCFGYHDKFSLRVI